LVGHIAAIAACKEELQTGKPSFRQVAVELLEAEGDEKPFDMAVAVRVGALDGRHREIEKLSLEKIAKALTPQGRLFIDGEIL